MDAGDILLAGRAYDSNALRHKLASRGAWMLTRSSWRSGAAVSFAMRSGETLALDGESGCVKTTTARLILKLLTPTAGRVLVYGEDIAAFKGHALRRFRTKVQVVFQDSWASLNPRMRVRDIVAEHLLVNAQHPYTQALLSAAPPSRPTAVPRQEIVLAGEVPSPIDPPSGCGFNPRCPKKIGNVCERRTPVLTLQSGSVHSVACHPSGRGKPHLA